MDPVSVTERPPPATGRAGRAQLPGPRDRLATLRSFRRDVLGFFLELQRDYGELVEFKILGRRTPFYLVTRPELIQRILVADNKYFRKGQSMQEARRILGDGLLSSEGDIHHRQRRLIQPRFSSGHLADYVQKMTPVIEQADREWRDGDERDMHLEMYKLTLNVIGRTLFTTDVDELSADMNDAISNGMRMVSRLTLPYSNIWEHLPLPALREMHRSTDYLKRTIAEMVDRRRHEDDPPDDLLTMLLRARRDGAEGLTDQLIEDETMTLFLAGHETTAAWFAWILYLLHQHPDVEERLVAELDSVLGGRPPTIEDVQERLPYLEMVLSETLRLYPSVWMVVRRPYGEYDLDGHLIGSNSVVLMPPWVVHRDARWYPDPSRFDPERWTLEERAKRPRYSFFPFGGGPRLCVGEGFAWYETRIGVALLLQRWKFRLCEDQAIEPAPLLSLRPRTGMRMRLEARG